ncbi:hypothetical protein TAMA11512_13650 [Selenomonas sp. TAMA-11512]|uniref:NADH-quinone oxidoreductase subunit NuoB n=1 Tax=Selenomonas sp. TAMA-11512 TaxID=3095337 RepID=UPI0030859191|nr:hypothetical protein TAMA11512_13650 [Selenomonas sp. TAMA-11512]
MFKVLERIFRDRIATETISLAGSARYRGKLVGSVRGEALEKAVAACPVGAIGSEDGTIDYKRCIFCGRCVDAALAVTPQTTLQHKSEDAQPFEGDGTLTSVDLAFQKRIGRSLHVRHLDAGSCNACDFEMGALSNPYYDLARFGVHFVASPRHADLLMVTGVVTRNLEYALQSAYEAMPEPRLVMATGACAAGGETYGASYATVGAVDQVLPVDIYVPGCPPRPAAMLIALLAAADMLNDRMKSRSKKELLEVHNE